MLLNAVREGGSRIVRKIACFDDVRFNFILVYEGVDEY